MAAAFGIRGAVRCRTGGYTGRMPEYTNHQKKIIERYYDNQDVILLNRLQELVTELYLADTDRKKDQLWKRAQTAMSKLKVGERVMEHIVSSRDPALLAENLKHWLDRANSSRR